MYLNMYCQFGIVEKEKQEEDSPAGKEKDPG